MPFPIPSPEGLQNALELADPPVHIGTGGFKAVYRMEAPDGPEAIKAVYVPPAGDENEDAARAQLIARAEREIEALGKCTNPALVKLGSLPPQRHQGHEGGLGQSRNETDRRIPIPGRDVCAVAGQRKTNSLPAPTAESDCMCEPRAIS